NTTYTFSVFFRRHYNVKPGGRPALSVFAIDSHGERNRLIAKNFSPVPDDYSVVRHSVTFTTPAKVTDYIAIEVLIWSDTDRWVQADGAQLVKGEYPTVYDPEDSLWDVLDGNYSIRSRHGTLWYGSVYLTDKSNIKPLVNIFDCETGWVLVWSRKGKDVAFTHTLIFKRDVITGIKGDRKNFHDLMSRSFSSTKVGVTGKIIYTDGYSITGASTNNKSDNGTNRVQLRAVYEF